MFEPIIPETRVILARDLTAFFSVEATLPTISTLQRRVGLVKSAEIEGQAVHLLSGIQLGVLVSAPGTWTQIGHHVNEAGILAGLLVRNARGNMFVTEKGRGFAKRVNGAIRWFPSSIPYMRSVMSDYIESLNEGA